MPINFVARTRKNPITSDVKYYATISQNGYVDLKQVAKKIEKISTVSSADIKAVLDSLQSVVIETLQNGQSVRLGDLGSFRPTLSSKGVKTADSCNANTIKCMRVRFSQSATMRKEMAKDNLSFSFSGVAD
jgi:predicted histone-like DNA-binding protein